MVNDNNASVVGFFDKFKPDMIAGAVSGALTASLCCPLDVAKTRIQAQGMNDALYIDFYSTCNIYANIELFRWGAAV
jgi:hypothetical protein